MKKVYIKFFMIITLVITLTSFISACDFSSEEEFSVYVLECANGEVSADKTLVKAGDLVTITATPAPGYVLEGVYINDELFTGNAFEMPEADVTVSASFVKIKYQINIEQPENGTIIADNEKAAAGEIVTLSATANEGYELVAFYVNGTKIEGNTFEMPAERVNVSAVFTRVFYQIEVIQPENGTLSLDKSATSMGDLVTVTALANDGYKLVAIYLNGVKLTGNSFEMPESNVTISAEFSKIEYQIEIVQPENGQLVADKLVATFGEVITLTATPDVAYQLESIYVDGNKINGNTFVMPTANVTVTAIFVEIFAKGENIGYAGNFISTSGVNVTNDKGSNPQTIINGSGEQYAYFNDVYVKELYVEVKINVESVLNNELYPKFGLTLETTKGRIAFYVAMSPSINANSIGRVYSNGNIYDWTTESLVDVANMEFTDTNYVTLALVRDASNVYFYVNGNLVMYENAEILSDDTSAVAVFSFNTLLKMKEYSIITGMNAVDRINQAEKDYLRLNGEKYGSCGNYKTSNDVDLTNDRGSEPYIQFGGHESPQHAYISNLTASKLYYEAEFNVLAIHNNDSYPKFGLFARNGNVSIYFYVDMKTDLTATNVGMVYVRNGAWDWNGSRSVKVSGIAFNGSDSVTLAIMKDGANFVYLVNGAFALAVPESELGEEPSIFGAFGFNTEMKVFDTVLDDSEQKISEIKKLIPMVGPSISAGTAYYLSEYKCDSDTNTITLLRSDSSDRTTAGLYEKGVPIFADRFAVEGTVRIFNTATSGAMASKIEFQVGINNSHHFKMCITRYESSSTTNNSVYIEGVNNKDNGYFNTCVKQNTLPGGTDYTANYKVIYDYGTIFFILDGEVQLVYETGWGKASYSFGVVRYADTIWSNTTVSLDDEVDALIEAYKSDYMEYKDATDLNKNEFIASNTEKTLASGGLTRVGGTLVANNPSGNSSNSVYIKNENGVVAEYRLFNDSGKWGVARIIDNKSEIIIAPAKNSYGWMNFEVAFAENTAAFMLNGKVYDKLEGSFANAEVAVGAKSDSASLKNTYIHAFADNQSALTYIESAPVYSYYSNYTNSINSNYNKYFTEGEIKEGGFLIIGASTVAGNFWETWEEDLGLTDYITGYNVAIGGTTTEDWLAAYDKLVKPFNPSCVLISVGGNDLGLNDARAIDVVNRLIKIIEKIHSDFPDAIIYYPYATPGPGSWENGVWNNPNYGLIRNYMKEYLDSTDFAFGIDTIEHMTRNGLPIKEYFRSDNIHYNELGYSVWSDILYNSISFPENLGKWEVISEVPMLENSMVKFGEEVTINFEETEFAGNEGLIVMVTSESGEAITVVRSGDVFKFVMPTSNVTVTYKVAVKHTNAIWTDDGVLVKGKYTSKSIDKNCGLVVGEHYANESIVDYLPEEITSNVYVFGYAVSTDGGTSFGEIIADPSLITLQEGDILKVYFAMMGNALSGSCVLTKYASNALENNLTLGYAGNKTGTRFWGALYQNGKIYTGNEYSVDFKLTLFKNAADENLVSEIYINSMPTSSITNGRKVFIRWEKNSCTIVRQGTDKVSSAYNSSLTKTNTGITVASADVLSITLDVNIMVTSTGFTITISNEQDKTQVYTETYTCADTEHKWENVSINFGFVQMGMATFSDIKIK